MAQTKRKRRSKHRGTAAGAVVSRGRTGRKPTAAESKQSAKDQARERRLQRHDKPPTWKGAAQRGGIATLLFVVLTIVAFRQSIAAALAISLFVLGLYTVMGYYTDLLLYNRRQKRKLKVEAAAREARAKERGR
jgi:UDP-N-acetylmuramyl pentapeptide phosphotransferase/UDP-N-acetylglucosamine-1-phosphate transferase